MIEDKQSDALSQGYQLMRGNFVRLLQITLKWINQNTYFEKMLIYLSFKRLFTINILLFISLISFTQNTNNSSSTILKELNKQAEDYYKLDDRLFIGKLYTPKYFRPTSGHPYFQSKNWENTSIFIKGIKYNNLQVKYNINQDKIILNYKTNDWKYTQIIMKDELVDSLIYMNRLIVNASILPVENISGYYELIYRGSFSAYIKHFKNLKLDFTNNDPNGTYGKRKQNLYILSGTKLLKGGSRKSIIKHFNPYKKQIRKYIRKNRILFNRIDSYQYIQLLKYCDEISSN